jgi:hypothetical protein
MATNALPVVGASQPSISGDVLWLASIACVFAAILVLVYWLLSAELSVHHPQVAASDDRTTSPIPETSSASAPVPPQGLVSGDRIARLGALPMPPDDIGGGSSNVAPPFPIIASGEQAVDKPRFADQSRQAAQSSAPPVAAGRPGSHRPQQHKQRVQPVTPAEAPQLTPW